ncbi:MAG: CHAD domain-containing protein [Anaerolineae bacterium]
MLSSTHTVSFARHAILCEQAAAMRTHENRLLEAGKPVDVHQMRVAIRRMRAAVDVFAPLLPAEKWLRQGLKRTARALAPVRDLDVLMERLQSLDFPLHDAIEELGSQRQAAYKAFQAYAASKKYRKFNKRFNGFLEQPAPEATLLLSHMVASSLYTRYEAIRAYETMLNDPEPETLHDLRIACKRLRYTLRFFDPVLGTRASAVRHLMRRTQDHLGALNDAHVGQEIVAQYIADPATRDRIAGQF